MEKLNVRFNAAVAGVISPTFSIIGNLFTCIFLFLMLLIANPMVTGSLFIFTGLFYLLVFSLFKKKIEKYGEFAPKYSAKTFKKCII